MTLAELAPSLRPLVLLLSSDKPGEVAAAAAQITRRLHKAGLDWHDLADALQSTALSKPTPAEPTPAELADACMTSGLAWKPHEADFLSGVVRFGLGWNALSEKQATWLRALHQRARWRTAA